MTTLALTALLAFAPANPGCDPAILQAFAVLDDAMRQTETDVEAVPQVPLRQRLRADLERQRRAAAVAQNTACAEGPRGQPRPRPDRPEPPAAPVLPVLDDAGHRGVLNAINSKSFEDDKLAVLGISLRDRCVTIDQARGYLGVFVFEKTRLKAFGEVTQRLTEPQRAVELLDSFTFGTSSKEAVKLLGDSRPDPRCVVSPSGRR